MSTTENASTSLLEALAAGCSIVTTYISGCPETVGNAGICVSPGQVKELSKTLKTLVHDENYRSQLMQAARKRATEIFNWSIITQKYIDLLQAAIRK